MIQIEDITNIYYDKESKGYYIEFNDKRKIHLTKRRTIITLLILIKFGEGTESDIAQGNTRINEIREILGSRLPTEYVADYYGDANKPYSELWNEEGFTFIDNLKGGRLVKSQKYTLHSDDHDKLFAISNKAFRKAPTQEQKEQLRKNQNNKCNFCGATIVVKEKLKKTTYAKDRRREVFDHRIPIEKGGESNLENYQALCFYCNKCKWQICNICSIKDCDYTCALRSPETSKTIAPTKENILDLLASRELFNN